MVNRPWEGLPFEVFGGPRDGGPQAGPSHRKEPNRGGWRLGVLRVLGGVSIGTKSLLEGSKRTRRAWTAAWQ